MDEFPNLNMSIGEYYKMLMEGKRPTRQRTVKEEVKKPSLPSMQRGGSLSVSQSGPAMHHGVGGLPRRDITMSAGGIGSGLGRSQSESGGKSSGQSKRKLKMKSKLRRQQREGGSSALDMRGRPN